MTINWRPLLFIILAACFSVAGDVLLKQFGDHRRKIDLVSCLVLWEGCAIAWVFAYLWKLPLGRTTSIGLLLTLTLNCIIGVKYFGETFTLWQLLGLFFGGSSILLLIFG
jgi:multidrug transporter EmrE-like cation transporter